MPQENCTLHHPLRRSEYICISNFVHDQANGVVYDTKLRVNKLLRGRHGTFSPYELPQSLSSQRPTLDGVQHPTNLKQHHQEYCAWEVLVIELETRDEDSNYSRTEQARV